MELWKEVYTPEQLQRVQELEMENLQVLKDVCEKMGIRFFAYGGTLIGAVRHKGFVPWDDDLDVAMFRADYDRFGAEAHKYLPETHVLQTPHNDPKSPYTYFKLRMKGTKYVEYGYHKLNTEQGVYVDIYPIDDLPDDNELYYKQFKQYQLMSKLYDWRQCPYLSNQSRSIKAIAKKLIKRCVWAMLQLVPQKYLVRKLDQTATAYNGTQSRRKGNLSYPKPVNVFYDVLPLETGEFNGQHIYLPGGWDQHLTSRYGDYMQLPPEEARLGHRPYILDIGVKGE